MAYESRAYDNEHGDPVVVMVVTGTHDVSRLIHLFKTGLTRCEQIAVGDKMLQQVRRHNGGRAALQLLAAHGGPDFLHDDGVQVEWGARCINVDCVCGGDVYTDHSRAAVEEWIAARTYPQNFQLVTRTGWVLPAGER